MPKKDPVPPRFAPDIRAELARRGLSQEQFAAQLGEQQWWISKRLTGHVPVRVEDLERIADALGMPASTFLSSERVA